MKKLIFACLPLALLVISCKKDGDSNPVVPEEKYMSITTNSKWTYDVINNPGTPGQTSLVDTVTVTSQDTSIGSRTYRIFKHSNANASDYYNITGNEYYRYQKQDLNGTPLSIEDLYLKDNQSTGASWSQTINLTVPGFPVAIPITVTNSVIEKGSSKTVNGTSYTDVIGIKTDIVAGGGLPANTIVTDIKSYYARKVGLIQADYKIAISTIGVDINTQTLLKTAVIQ
ncbi:MAG TPA: hypothetical protein PLC48_12900 [Ferruginibacter sp.]|nr:hypothetical protein [Ferruginibacter sp.]